MSTATVNNTGFGDLWPNATTTSNVTIGSASSGGYPGGSSGGSWLNSTSTPIYFPPGTTTIPGTITFGPIEPDLWSIPTVREVVKAIEDIVTEGLSDDKLGGKVWLMLIKIQRELQELRQK